MLQLEMITTKEISKGMELKLETSNFSTMNSEGMKRVSPVPKRTKSTELLFYSPDVLASP